MQLDSEEIDWRARTHMATDPSASYADAVRFVVADADDPGGRVHLAAGADPESLKLHDRAMAIIEAARLKGKTVTFLEAIRQIQQEDQAKP